MVNVTCGTPSQSSACCMASLAFSTGWLGSHVSQSGHRPEGSTETLEVSFIQPVRSSPVSLISLILMSLDEHVAVLKDSHIYLRFVSNNQWFWQRLWSAGKNCFKIALVWFVRLHIQKWTEANTESNMKRRHKKNITTSVWKHRWSSTKSLTGFNINWRCEECSESTSPCL